MASDPERPTESDGPRAITDARRPDRLRSPGIQRRLPRLWEALRASDPNVPCFQARTMEDSAAAGILGAWTAWLGVWHHRRHRVDPAPWGLYGMLSHSVSQRTQEIGVRPRSRAGAAKLGSAIRDGVVLVRSVSRRSPARRWSGGRCGVSVSNQPRSDPVSFLAVSPAAGRRLRASYLPARRAMKADPVVALRESSDLSLGLA